MFIQRSPVATAESSKPSGYQTSHVAQVHENKFPVGSKKVIWTKLSDGCQKVCQTDVPEGSHTVHDDDENWLRVISQRLVKCQLVDVTMWRDVNNFELSITERSDDDEVAMIDTSACVEQDNEPFKMVGERKHKKETKLSDGPEKEVKLTVYMEGRGSYSLVKAVTWNHADAFQATIDSLCKPVKKIDVKGKAYV